MSTEISLPEKQRRILIGGSWQTAYNDAKFHWGWKELHFNVLSDDEDYPVQIVTNEIHLHGLPKHTVLYLGNNWENNAFIAPTHLRNMITQGYFIRRFAVIKGEY